jgi:hypothetical protein
MNDGMEGMELWRKDDERFNGGVATNHDIV